MPTSVCGCHPRLEIYLSCVVVPQVCLLGVVVREAILCVLVCKCVCIPPYVDWSNALHDRVSRSAAGGILAQQHVLHFHLRAKSDVQMTEAGNELVYPSRLRPPVKNTMTVAGVGVGGE